MYFVNVDKVNSKSVFVSVRFNDERLDNFVKQILNHYCKRKQLKPIGIAIIWQNKGNFAKILRKKPYFLIYIVDNKYEDMFSILQQLLKGKEYMFENEYEANTFSDESKQLIEKYLKDRLEKFIFPILKNEYNWNLTKEDRSLIDSETTPFGTTSEAIYTLLS